jgi:type I restriction enzyme S subunit
MQISGSAQPGLKSGFVKKVVADIPRLLGEQAKIAEILSTVDKAIEQTEALIGKQQRIKAGLMQDLFSRGVDANGGLRSEKTHSFQDSPVGRIPSEWDVISLGKAGTWSSGGTPSKAIPRFWGGDVPWVCPKDMKTFDLETSIERITDEGARCGSRLMPVGTVFIVIRGMILAHTFPVGYTTRTMAFNQDVKAVVTKPGLNSRYLAYWLVAHEQAILKIATTATHGTKRFDMDDLFAVKVAVPKPEEQAKIVGMFDELEHQIEMTKDHANKFRALKYGLLQDLLTGNRRVTALLSEPLEAIA